MKRLFSPIARALRTIGRQIAATVRFGALPAASAPRGEPSGHVDPAAVAAGIGQVGRDEDEVRTPR